MSEIDPQIVQLAALHGISTEFCDWKGTDRTTDAASIVACLKAMGVDTDRPDWVERGLVAANERPWRRALPPCVVATQNREKTVDVHVQAGHGAHVWVMLENGSDFDLDQVDNHEPDRWVGDRWLGRATFRLPTWVAPGYHRLFLESDGQTWQTSFIVTPGWVGTPGLGTEPLWGFMTQLYSVCGESSWGVGDFCDMSDLGVWSATAHKADFLLINPTHAAEVAAPMEPSPYFPATRRYINPLYIRPEWVEEYATAAPKVREQVQACRRQAIAAAQSSPQVERDPVWQAKRQALREIFNVGRRPSRQMEFEAYMAGQGAMLRHYATWCVLTEAHGPNWRDWPAALQDPESREVEVFETQHGSDVAFYMWLQWIGAGQAERAHRTMLDAGMRIGVMADLAVGVNRHGEETWAMQQLFAQGVTVGAPPDAYNQAGQDWLQPPWRPDALAEVAYAPFRSMIRSILRQSRAVRVDHILGLFRLWWIPEGMSPDKGAYVRYDHEAMVGILALEAVRAQATVVGEDLGTVEPWVREYLAQRGILGTSILWFEMGEDGLPSQPESWRQLCLGSVTTHDLPPTLGYLAHSHIDLRHRLGLLTESVEDEIERATKDQELFFQLMADRGWLAPGTTDPHQILLALHRFLIQTPAKLRCVALTDAVGETRTQNQPGTIDEYPNWRVPLHDESGHRLTLEQIYRLTSLKEVTDILNGKMG